MTRALILFWAAFVFAGAGWIGFAAGQANARDTVRVVDAGCIEPHGEWHVAKSSISQ